MIGNFVPKKNDFQRLILLIPPRKALLTFSLDKYLVVS